MPNSELGRPFGYLKPASTGDGVNLLVLPYDYPTLAIIVNKLLRVHKGKPPVTWVQVFRRYLSGIPPYYYNLLRNAMRRAFGPQVCDC